MKGNVAMYPRVHHFRITGSLSEPALPLSVALLWGNITLFILQERKFISENGKQGLKPCTETKRNSCVRNCGGSRMAANSLSPPPPASPDFPKVEFISSPLEYGWLWAC